MDGKEKVKDFNQHFLSLRNKIPAESRPTEGVVTEFYTLALPQTMAMFVKQAQKATPQGNFAETTRVEKDVTSLKVNHQLVGLLSKLILTEETKTPSILKDYKGWYRNYLTKSLT